MCSTDKFPISSRVWLTYFSAEVKQKKKKEEMERKEARDIFRDWIKRTCYYLGQGPSREGGGVGPWEET